MVLTYIRKCTTFGNICTILENGCSFDCREQMSEKFSEMCKIQKIVQNYEECAQFRERCKIMRNVQNYEKCAEFKEICKIQRNVQNSEKHSKL